MQTIKTVLVSLLLASNVLYLAKTLDNPTRLRDCCAASPSGIAEASNRSSASLASSESYPQDIHRLEELWKSPREAVAHYAARKGYSPKERKCVSAIIAKESSWNPKAKNKHSSAYGLFQQLKLKPGSSIKKQIRLGFKYIQHRYGTACKALEWHLKNGWY